jgi:colanic acid/amylovoran biosynthesis glycosyltransferase
MAERIAALGCPREKLHVVRLPADEDGLRALAPERPDGLLVGMAGRFCEKKGFDVGIRAFAEALGGREDARLLMVGGGELEPELRRLAAEAGIEGQTEFAGRLPFDAFMTRLGGCSLALHPSRTAADGDSEGGAPVTLIESQWLGVPAIVSDHDDLSFVSAPDGSVTLPPLDTAAWAATLADLAGAPARLAAMADAARSFAREQHSPAANAAAREAIYRA